MPNEFVSCDTPRYVLLEDREPIGPEVIVASLKSECVAIYGFSGKHTYDVFISNSDLELRPYPLMKGYLRNRIEEEGDQTYLIIVDARSSSDESVIAATMATVLAAQNAAEPQTKHGFEIKHRQGSSKYEWNESVDENATEIPDTVPVA